jgi:hypothetical protein
MAIVRSAMGKSVDMSALVSKNEKTRAVSNVKNLNARGDTIDAFGKVIKPVTEKVNNAYSKTVGNRSAQPTRPKPRIQADAATRPAIDVTELTPEELELEEAFNDDLEVEQIKLEEIKTKETKKK